MENIDIVDAAVITLAVSYVVCFVWSYIRRK